MEWWWLVYERCPGCERESCFTCYRDRHLTLRAVLSAQAPEKALVGPCETQEILLTRFLSTGNVFRFDEKGQMYFFIEVERK